MKNQKKIKAYALMFDGKFTYYGGIIDRLAVFQKEDHARAFGDMFLTNRKQKKPYKVVPCTINLTPKKK